MANFFRVERVCNAKSDTTLPGVRAIELISKLKSGDEECAVEGAVVFIKHNRGSNIASAKLIKNPGQLCEDPCPKCGARVNRRSGFKINEWSEQFVNPAVARGAKLIDCTKE